MSNKQKLVEIKNMTLNYPIYNNSSLSFKKKLLVSASGGLINEDPHDKTVNVTALKKINLDIFKGDRLGVVGHNGSGKTTLLRVLSGIFFPTDGEVIIKGKPTSLIDLNLGIDPEATGRENIKIRAAILGISRLQLNKILEEIIEFTDLGNFIDLPFRVYSAGMQLRLSFAVATSIKPQILILDEWLSAGDAEFQVKANKRLNSLIDGSDVLVIASHSPELVKKICNRVIHLEHGSIISDKRL